MALDEPRTARRWRTARGRAVGLLAGGALLVAAAVALGRVAAGDDEVLRRGGERVAATVVGVSPATLLDSGRVTVEYPWRGTTRRASVAVNLEVDEVEPGGELLLLVDPDDPGRVQAPGVGGRPSSVGFPVVVLGLGGLTLLGLGGVAGWRVRRWGSVLRAHPWRRTTFRYGQTSGGLARAVLLLDGDDAADRRPVGVRRAPRWALRHLQVRGEGTLVVAGPPDGEQVVAPLSRLELFGVRPPRNAREDARWRTALTAPGGRGRRAP